VDGKIKILFVYKSLSPFIEDDLRILQRHFCVDVVKWRGYFNVWNFVKIFKKMLSTDMSFTWFENYRSAFIGLLGKLLGKKSVVVAAGAITLGCDWQSQKGLIPGGNIPGILFFSKFAVNLADVVLAVSEYKKKGILKYTNPKHIRIIPNCFSCEKYKPNGKKENIVLTICYLTSANIKRKGLETFIASAELLPEIQFLIVGKDIDGTGKLLQKTVPVNVNVITAFTDEELIHFMQRAKVYAQLSSMESFGAALAEAMLCECVPVATDRGNLPEVVGDTGFYCEYEDIRSTVEAIKKALNSGNGSLSRQRIKAFFPLEKREEQIVSTIKSLFKHSAG